MLKAVTNKQVRAWVEKVQLEKVEQTVIADDLTNFDWKEFNRQVDKLLELAEQSQAQCAILEKLYGIK